MKWLAKLERKFGRYAIHNLMKYIVVLQAIGFVLSMFDQGRFYYTYLSLDISMVLQGQVWRLFTYLIQPTNTNIFFFLIEMYLYWMIGSNLENTWGAFRFNLYYISGMLFNIIAAVIMYAVTGLGVTGSVFGLSYINQSMFLAFAVLYPDMQLLLMYIIPIKIKYLGIIYAIMIGYEVVMNIISGSWPYAVAILVAIANFLVFYFATRNYRRLSPKDYKRRTEFKRAVNQSMPKGVTRHKCAVCGRTEKDAPNLEFRFCSKCEGNYEYCSDHLFSHTHIKRN